MGTANSVSAVLVEPLLDRAEKLSRVLGQIPADEPDSVHQLRVTGRRLNVALWMLGKAARTDADATAISALRDDVRWLTTVAARVRDLEVIADQLGDAAARVARTERSGELARLTEVLRSSPSDRLPGHLSDFAESMRPKDLERSARKTSRKCLRRSDRRMRRALDALEGTPPSDAALHAVRKTMRRARYVAEIAEPALGSAAADYAAGLSDCQSILGAHQDASVALAWLRSRRTEVTTDPDLVRQLIQEQQQARADFAAAEVPALLLSSH